MGAFFAGAVSLVTVPFMGWFAFEGSNPDLKYNNGTHCWVDVMSESKVPVQIGVTPPVGAIDGSQIFLTQFAFGFVFTIMGLAGAIWGIAIRYRKIKNTSKGELWGAVVTGSLCVLGTIILFIVMYNKRKNDFAERVCAGKFLSKRKRVPGYPYMLHSATCMGFFIWIVILALAGMCVFMLYRSWNRICSCCKAKATEAVIGNATDKFDPRR